jgi:spermidine synthase
MTETGRVESVPWKTVSILFFVSGMTGLSYEVIWFKQFSHVWGSSTLAMGSVVGSFLFGLGLGGYLCGRIADRVRRPVFWYGLFEIGVGLLATVIPWGTDLVWRFSAQYYAALRESFVAYALVRCATTLLVIGPACLLMGGTLPLLVRQFAPRAGLGRAAGWLYGVNTLGAAAGCYFIGFHLLPELGLFWTNVSTAMANLVVGFVAVAWSGRVADDAGLATKSIPAETIAGDVAGGGKRQVSRPAGAVTAAYVIAGMTGGAALVLQTVWSRQLTLVLGSSTYAFTAVLFVVLGGIGMGSLLYRALFGKGARDAGTAAGMVVVLILSTIGGMRLLPFVAQFVGTAVLLRGNFVLNALVCVGASIVLEFVPAVAMGVLLPFLVELAGRSASAAGRVVGNVYACNTVGTLFGAVATSVWFVPAWGTRAAAAGGLAAYVVAGLLLAGSAGRSRGAFAALAVAALSVVWFFRVPENPLDTNMGMFMYGYNRKDQIESEVLFFKEGAATNVLVTRMRGETGLRVNGKIDGSAGAGDMPMQLGLAYLPRFLNPHARNVLVIGFGTGTTSGTSGLFPRTHVTCCEIEPEVVKAAAFFASVNHSPHRWTCPRFTVVYDDARAYVQGTNEKYDLILSAPSNPWIAGVSNLFTAEFYGIAARKLTAGGIFAQWIQSYSLTPDDYAMVVRTVCDVFPHQRLIRVTRGDTILVGSNEPLDRDATIVRDAQRLVDASPAMQSDLTTYFQTSDVAAILLTRVLLDEAGLQRLLDADGSKHRNSDGNLQLEFRAARHLYAVGGDRLTRQSVMSAARSEWFVGQFKRLGCEQQQAEALHYLAGLFRVAGLVETAGRLAEFGLSQDPHNPKLLADELLILPYPDPELLDRLLAVAEPSAAIEATRVGRAYLQNRQYSAAVTVFERLCAKFPDSATSWVNLALSHYSQGNRDEALKAIHRGLELDPANEQGLRASMMLRSMNRLPDNSE